MESSLGKLGSNLDDDQWWVLESFIRKTKFLSLWGEKVYIPMSLRIAGSNLKKQSYHQKIHFEEQRQLNKDEC